MDDNISTILNSPTTIILMENLEQMGSDYHIGEGVKVYGSYEADINLILIEVFKKYDIQYVFDGMRFYIKNYSFDHTPNYVIINQLGEKSIFDLRKMVKDSENYFRNERLYS